MSNSTTALFSSLTLATACLGAWQVRRYFWKIDLLESRDASLHAPPVDVSRGALVVRPFTRVTLRGATADAARLSTVEPRVAPAELPAPLAALTRANAGRCVVLPLLRADGTRVLALAGWVPSDADAAAAAAAWARGVAAADAAPIEGVVRDSEKPGVWAVPHGGGATSGSARDAVFAHIDVRGLAAAAGLDAARGDEVDALVEVIRPFPDRAHGSPWPVTRQIAAMRDAYTAPHTHLIYAGTWLTLAAYGAVTTAARFRGRGGVRSVERKLL
jgi:surfeit locus 1 family protein